MPVISFKFMPIFTMWHYGTGSALTKEEKSALMTTMKFKGKH